MMSDQFCLRWNNFQSNIVSALDSLKCSEDLVDVTLTCEGRNIKAHKVILSACSPYFRTVFKENPCQHPIIILKDVLADDIINLLSYMYQGEVFIEESKLSSFLHTAALLQVKGLTGATHHVRENMTASPANVANKLYTQLTISHKEVSSNTQRDIRIIPQYKRRRNSASDRLTDTIPNECSKRTRVCETFDEPLRLDITASPSNDSGGKSDTETTNRLGDGSPKSVTGDDKDDPVNNHVKVQMQGKSSPQESSAVNIKNELGEPSKAASGTESASGNSDSAEASEAHPEYENSMLARSLLSGVHALKSDLNANISPPKSKPLKSADIQCLSKRESLAPNVPLKKISLRSSPQMQEEHIKAEMMSPKSDIDYEPEVVISEQNDSLNTDSILNDDRQSSLILLTGLTSGAASTSQGISQAHAQANHAAICGDCPHCGMKYSNQSALKYHVRLMHSDLTNRLCCYLCPRSFTMREFFKEHMWNTHGQRN